MYLVCVFPRGIIVINNRLLFLLFLSVGFFKGRQTQLRAGRRGKELGAIGARQFLRTE